MRRQRSARRRRIRSLSRLPSSMAGSAGRQGALLCRCHLRGTGAERPRRDGVEGGGRAWERNLSNLAKLALAGLYHQTNRDAQAIDLYNAMVAKPSETVSAAVAQLDLADLYAATGKQDRREFCGPRSRTPTRTALPAGLPRRSWRRSTGQIRDSRGLRLREFFLGRRALNSSIFAVGCVWWTMSAARQYSQVGWRSQTSAVHDEARQHEEEAALAGLVSQYAANALPGGLLRDAQRRRR